MVLKYSSYCGVRIELVKEVGIFVHFFAKFCCNSAGLVGVVTIANPRWQTKSKKRDIPSFMKRSDQTKKYNVFLLLKFTTLL